ncbi:hypothetical protein OTK01_000330 [Caldicellulosiruptor acetigenus]|uniref:hypothetical protein n=1 Tax=Caldicellulosiruptor acetigenus TaxID=301953 RepID=UPI0022A96402|nr:hypothetical protein [Caldicellulosiruptor acetigenus]WAM36556.1 hypothetical protein OTK01_000330 [Caldicellulosiruptor acetigenus]
MIPPDCKLIIGLPETIQEDTIIIYHDEKYDGYDREENDDKVHVFEQYLWPEKIRIFFTTLNLNDLTLVQKLRDRVQQYIQNKTQLDIIVVPVTDFSIREADIVTISPAVVFRESGKRKVNFYFSILQL